MPWIKRPDRREQCRKYDQYRRANPALASVAKFRSSRKWRECSKAFLDHNPLCCDPFGDHSNSFSPASAVHHKVPLAEDITLGLVWSNLAALCVCCHNRIEADERTGKRFQWDHLKPQPIS